MANYFAFDDSEYTRTLNPVADFIDIQSFFLNKMRGVDVEKAREWVKQNMKPTGLFPVKDKKTYFLSREDQIDRVRKEGTILEYIHTARTKEYIMSPAWTCYIPTYRNESLYVGFIDEKSKIRSRYKKLLFVAEQKQDEVAISFNDGMQSSAKIDINSISGAAVQSVTINHCASLHPSLTSICAASTSHANLNNEKLIAGNRLYRTMQVTLDAICAICLRADLPTLQQAMDEFNVHYPTVDETMECINYSTDLYWRNANHTKQIRDVVEKLIPLERAAIVYIGDLFHLDKLNPELVERFLTGFTNRQYTLHPDPKGYHTKDNVDVDVEILAKLICKDYMIGRTMDDVIEQSPDQYAQIVSNMEMINNHLDNYQVFIKAFLRPNFLNPGVMCHNIRSMVRRAVLTSDTDSTIFTTQYWVKRINGNIGFEDRHYNIGFVISFLVNKTVFHQLAMMSANLGLERKNLHMISMKNEFYFPTYSLTNSSKNYFAYKSVREGNVYPKMKLEKKGVELRSSKVPKNVMNQFDDWICYLMDLIIAKQSITIDELFLPAYTTESQVKESVENGYAEYFQTTNIKSADSYKLGEDAPALAYHRLWENVFAPKYGKSPELPYTALKVSTKIANKSAKNRWIESIKDEALKARLIEYFKTEGKDSLEVIYVPKLTIGRNQLPEEIRMIVDTEKQVMNVTSQYYAVLEAFGFYLRNDQNTNMIYKYYKPKPRHTVIEHMEEAA